MSRGSAYSSIGRTSGRRSNLSYAVRPTYIISARRQNDVVWFTGISLETPT